MPAAYEDVSSRDQKVGLGFRGLPRPSNVVPFWVWYDFLVRVLARTTKKVLHWRVLVWLRDEGRWVKDISSNIVEYILRIL